MPKHAALPGLNAQLFQRWLALFRQTTATLGNDAMAERANELAGRIAESLWYGYQCQPGGFRPGGPRLMDSAILSLLAAFLLSIIGLFAFIWSLRKGLLVENPAAASVIFARGEVGRVDDPRCPPRDGVRCSRPPTRRPRPPPMRPTSRPACWPTAPAPFPSSCSRPSPASGCCSDRPPA